MKSIYTSGYGRYPLCAYIGDGCLGPSVTGPRPHFEYRYDTYDSSDSGYAERRNLVILGSPSDPALPTIDERNNRMHAQ